MIPKIIHYCWFGKKPLDTLSKACIQSWREHLPEFKIKCWSEENFDTGINDYVSGAITKEQWAFVADYARVWVLEKHGGIYIDTDMMLLGSLESYLDCSFFIGCEKVDTVSCGIIGSVKNHKYLREILNFYGGQQFNVNNRILIPSVFTTTLQKYGFRNCESVVRIQDMHIFPPDFFYPLPFSMRDKDYKNYLTKNSVSVHLWAESWKSEFDFLREANYAKALKLIGYGFDKKANGSYFLLLIKSFLFGFSVKMAEYIFPERIRNYVKNFICIYISPFFINPTINRILSVNPVFFAKRRSYLLPSESSKLLDKSVTVKKNGVEFQLDLYEHNGWRVYFNIFYEGTYRLFKIVRPNFNIIDVGANFGYYSLNFARQAIHGNVYAYEPDSFNFHQLVSNINANNLKNIFPFNFALGDENGKCEIEIVNRKNLGMNRISLNGKFRDTFLFRLDTLEFRNKIDLIKVDVEGYEFKFLVGASQLLKRDKPIMFIEFCDANLNFFGTSGKALFLYLKEELKYRHIVNADSLESIDEFYHFNDCFFDVLAFDDDNLFNQLRV